MDYITALEKYSADKELVFKSDINSNFQCTKCLLPKVKDVNRTITAYVDYAERVSVSINLSVNGEHYCINLIDRSKAQPVKLYKKILKQLENKKARINEETETLQKSYNYKKEAIKESACFDTIAGVKKDEHKIYGYYSNCCKLISYNIEKNARLEFSSDKKEIAKILKCLLDNGIIKPM